MIAATLNILAQNIVSINGGNGIRLTSDLVTDRDRLAPGLLHYSIAWAYTGRDFTIDSNPSLYGYAITIWIRWRLSDPNNENTYLSLSPYKAETMLRALGDPTWWGLGATLIGVNPDFYAFQPGDGSLTLTEPEREGNIISFSAVAKILLNV